MESIPHSTIDDLRAELCRYRPQDVLVNCHKWALKFSSQSTSFITVDIPRHLDIAGRPRSINVAPYYIALIARFSLLGGHSLAPSNFTPDAFLRLLNIVSQLYEPITDPTKFFIQTAYEQFPYQNPYGRAIPRALLMYRDAYQRLKNPGFDMPADFLKRFGIDIEDFIAVGCAFYAKTLSEEAPFLILPFRFVLSPKMSFAGLAQVLTHQKVDAFLAFNSADQQKFKSTNAQFSTSADSQGRYDFNPLWKLPLIDLRPKGLLAPLPNLLVWRIYNGPYMELRDAYNEGGRRNSFTSFFGKVFEQYIGILLEDIFPKQDVIPELTYGKQEKKGPDWIIKIGSVGIAVECTTSSLTLPAKAMPTSKAIKEEIGRNYVSKIEKLPGKISELMEDSVSSSKLQGISRWHFLLVCRDSLYPSELFRKEFFDPAVTVSHPYHILDVEDFESLLALQPAIGLDRVLSEKEANHEKEREDFNHFLLDISRRNGIRLKNSTLERTRRQFFNDLAPNL